MTRRAFGRLTLVLFLLISVWLLGRTAYYGGLPPALTALSGNGAYWEGSIRLPIPLPFWRDLLAAPLISLLIAVTIHACKDESDQNVEMAFAFFWVFTTALTAFAFGWTNAGLLISFLIGATTVGVALATVLLLIAGGIKTCKWIFA